MLKYLIKFSYDGSKYNGFQRLKNNASVQKELEESLTKVFKEKIDIKGSGRTDKGVHALNQCASFDAPFKIDCDLLVKAINRNLGNYIYVKEAQEVDELLLSAKGKDRYKKA